MKLTLNGRAAEVVVVVEFYACDSYIHSGVWLDTDEECTDDELDRLYDENDYEISEYIIEHTGTWRD